MMTVSSLRRDDAAGAAEVGDLRVLELAAHVLGDEGAAGEDGDVLEDRLAAVAEARGLDGERVDRAAQLVDDERGERLAVDVVGDDDDVLRHLEDALEDGQEVLHGGDASCR